MKVSVVIPTHNVSAWITEALDSVHAQTRQPDEVVVVDDNSTDDTVEKIRSHPLPVKLVSCNAQNAAVARNLGVESSTSDFIAFLDGDDYWDADRLSVLEGMESEVDAYFLNCRFLFLDGSVEDRPPIASLGKGVLNHSEFEDAFVASHTTWQTGGMVVRRSVFQQIGGFDVSQKRVHDVEMFMRAVYQRKWRYHPTPTWTLRVGRPGSISSAAAECGYFLYQAMRKNLSRYHSEGWKQAMKQTAKSAVSIGARAGALSRTDLRWSEPMGELGYSSRVAYQVANLCPSLFDAIRKLRER